MKLKGILCGLLALFLWQPLLGQAATAPMPETVASQGNLTLRVTGIRSDNGVIRVALFNNQAAYEERNPTAPDAYARAKLEIKNGTAVWQLSNLPYGVYGIKLYHDEDDSGILKKTFVGRPTEGVGFSNNPGLHNHAPTFDDVKFTINQSETNLNIQMINPE